MNYYSSCSNTVNLKCSKEQYLQLQKLLSQNKDNHNFSIEYDNKEKDIHIYADENFDNHELPYDFLIRIGSIIKNNKLKFLEFGWAFYGDKPAVGAFNGGSFRITNSGRIVYPTITWKNK